MTPRRRSFWVNVSLVAAALVALAVVVVTEHLWTSGELAARSNHLVVGFRAEDVERLTVTEGQNRVVIERQATETTSTDLDPDAPVSFDQGALDSPELRARWVVLEPYQGEAEEAAADALLRAVEFATVLRQVPSDGFDRAAAGLDSPERTIELSLGDVRTRLRFGAQAPSPAGARYVEVAGEGTANKGVYVVSKMTSDELRVAPDEFRIRQLVPYAASKLRAVTLSAPERAPVRLMNEDGVWKVQVGETMVRIAHSVWERLFAAFARSHASIILKPSPAELGGAIEQAQVEAILTPMAEGNPVARLRFGGSCPDNEDLELAFRLAPDPISGCVKPLFLATFLTDPRTLADVHLFSLQADQVEEWSATSGEVTLELARRENGWQMRQPEAGAVEQRAGNARVEALLDVTGQLLTQAPTGVELQSVVSARTGGETDSDVREQRVEVYASQPDVDEPAASKSSEAYAHRIQDGAWLRIPASALRVLTPDALLLKDTQIARVESKQVKGFVLRTPDWTQSVAVNVNEADDVCQYRIPEGLAIDRALCVDVVDALRTLRAQAWVSERDTGEFGLQTPVVRAQLQTGTDTGFDLEIGSVAAGSGHYARLKGDPAVFTVARSFVDTITTLLLDRSPFMLKPELYDELTVSTAERRVVLRRLGQEFVHAETAATESPRVKLTPGQVEEIIDALSFVRPEAAVTGRGFIGDVLNRRYGFDRPLLEVRPSDGPAWIVGAGDVYRNVSIYYARIQGQEDPAVFALPRQAVQRILDALSG